MKRAMERILLAIATFCTALLAAWADDARWQGVSYPYQDGPAHQPDVFLVTDTGGSGGGFGRGDPHHHLSDIAFWDGKYGWACGYGGVFKSDDGGLTWQRAKPQKGERGGAWIRLGLTGPRDIWLLEGEHPGGPGRAWLWHSTDDGHNWQEVAPGKMPGYLDFYCQDDVIWVLGGWIVPPGTPVLNSSDGGRTWRAVDFQGLLTQAWRVALPADHQLGSGYAVYVLGLGIMGEKWQARLVKSIDGGRTWVHLPLPGDLRDQDFWNFGQIYFPTTQIGWLGLDHGRLLYTHDGGQTWQQRKLPTDRGVAAMWFDPLGRGFVAVNNTDIYHVAEAVYRTLDGGQTWQPVLSGYKQINRFFSLGNGQLWAVGVMPSLVPNDIVAILKPDGWKP